jgi:hypothetical protein
MWPFWRKSREAREIRRAFSAYMSPEVVEKLARGEDVIPSPETKVIPYVVFQVRDDRVDDVQLCLSQAIPIVRRYDVLLETMMHSTVAVSMFRIGTGAEMFQFVPGSQEQLVNELLEALGPNIRIVYGSAEGLWGSIEVAKRFSFGALVPGFNAVLATLGQLEFGSSKRLESEPA